MFSERLKELRKNAGYTQKEIAEHIGTSQPSYQNWEKGSRKPSRETIQKLADFFKVSTDYDGTPITDNDRMIIKDFLKEYFANNK